MPNFKTEIFKSRALGLAVRQFRRRAGLTQKALGLKAGLTGDAARTWITQVEIGARKPTIDLLFRLAGALGVSVDDLLQAALVPCHRQPGGQVRRRKGHDLASRVYRRPATTRPGSVTRSRNPWTRLMWSGRPKILLDNPRATCHKVSPAPLRWTGCDP